MSNGLIKKIQNRNVQALLLFIASLAVFNIAFISSNGWARLAWNTLGYLTLYIAYRLAKLNLNAVGLARKNLKNGFKYGFGIAGLIVAVMLVVFFIDKELFKDSRYHHSLLTAVYSVVILLPLKTVFFEELAFRGILPAIALKIKDQRRFAALVSSLAFGAWHIYSATKIGDYHLGGLTIPNIFVIVAVFVATSAAGFAFYALRLRSGSLIAPIIVHWFLNGFGTILAALSWS